MTIARQQTEKAKEDKKDKKKNSIKKAKSKAEKKASGKRGRSKGQQAQFSSFVHEPYHRHNHHRTIITSYSLYERQGGH